MSTTFTRHSIITHTRVLIHRLCGLTRSRPGVTPVLESESPYWIYRYDRPELPGKWLKILPGKDGDSPVPQPRYAHQVVYDSKSEVVYMHGGNAGLGIDEVESEPDPRPSGSGSSAEARPSVALEADTESRLDDFWQLEIVRCVCSVCAYSSKSTDYNSTYRPNNEEIVRRALYEIRQQQ